MFEYIFLHTILCSAFVKDVLAHVDSAKLQEECNIAQICRHDQVPICGIDSCGEMRTYIDACDMHEFNCDNKKGPNKNGVQVFWDYDNSPNDVPDLSTRHDDVPAEQAITTE